MLVSGIESTGPPRQLFDDIGEAGLEPDRRSYEAIVEACVEAKEWEWALKFLSDSWICRLCYKVGPPLTLCLLVNITPINTIIVSYIP